MNGLQSLLRDSVSLISSGKSCHILSPKYRIASVPGADPMVVILVARRSKKNYQM